MLNSGRVRRQPPVLQLTWLALGAYFMRIEGAGMDLPERIKGEDA